MPGSRSGMAVLAAFAAAALVLALRGSTVLQASERMILDRLVAGRAPPSDDPVTLIEIREEDVRLHWPIETLRGCSRGCESPEYSDR